jgi:hypothetical protein
LDQYKCPSNPIGKINLIFSLPQKSELRVDNNLIIVAILVIVQTLNNFYDSREISVLRYLK